MFFLIKKGKFVLEKKIEYDHETNHPIGVKKWLSKNENNNINYQLRICLPGSMLGYEEIINKHLKTTFDVEVKREQREQQERANLLDKTLGKSLHTCRAMEDSVVYFMAEKQFCNFFHKNEMRKLLEYSIPLP